MTDTKKARGRPRAFDEAAAVAAAERLFRIRGYDGAGVAELSREMGVNPPSLYGAFGSKAGLLARALARYELGDAAFVARALEEPDAARFARALLRGAARAYAPRNGCAGCLAIETARRGGDPEARAAAAARIGATRAALRDRLAADPAATVGAEAGADALMAALAGLSGLACLGWSEGRLDAAACRLADGFSASFSAGE